MPEQSAVISYVCPTYVGMNRPGGTAAGYGLRMPHVCGDEPIRQEHSEAQKRYAPRMWG